MKLQKTGKIIVSLLTIGITGTVAWYGYKAVKKHIAKKKALKESSIKQPEIKPESIKP